MILQVIVANTSLFPTLQSQVHAPVETNLHVFMVTKTAHHTAQHNWGKLQQIFSNSGSMLFSLTLQNPYLPLHWNTRFDLPNNRNNTQFKQLTVQTNSKK